MYPCIYTLLPLELAVCVCKWASAMILLFSMWIENVAYHDDEIEQVAKQFKWSVCQWGRYIVYISRLSGQLEAQEDKHSYHYC